MNTTANNGSDYAVLILILGIIALLMFQILGPIPWYMGNKALRTMGPDAKNRGYVVAGRILGMIATALFLVGIIFALLLFVFIPFFG